MPVEEDFPIPVFSLNCASKGAADLRPIPTRNKFTYHAILIPKNISDDYLPCWIDGVGAGYSFAFPWPDTYASIVDKTVSFNGETYSMSGYYVDMSGANGGYNLTIVKKNQ